MSAGIARRCAAAGVEYFDLSGEPCQLAAGRWTRHVRRDPAAMLGVVLHSWGVSVGTSAAQRRLHGEPLALARRGLAAPYTISCGVTRTGVPVVAVCHPPERYTFASDAGNAHYLAIGVMGRFAFEARTTSPNVHTPASDALAMAVDAALGVAADLLAEVGVDAPGLITHRQCANDRHDHVACPGEEVVRLALGTSSAERYLPDPDLIPPGATHGKPWPDAWRRHVPAPRSVVPVDRGLPEVIEVAVM